MKNEWQKQKERETIKKLEFKNFQIWMFIMNNKIIQNKFFLDAVPVYVFRGV